jgi:hypothetical protein
MTGIGNCWCQKPQLTGIPCDHLFVVCSFRKLDYTQYVSPYYTIQYYINIWSGHWRSYDNRRDWSMYNGPIIRLDLAKINKRMRRKTHNLMVMDELEGRINMMSTRGRAHSSIVRFRLPVCLCFFIVIFIRTIGF